MRKSIVSRITKETDIKVELNLDGTGKCDISTGIGFFDHMLTAFSVHSQIDLSIKVKGDLFVDGHHTVEDTGIVLGDAVKKALGDKKGIARYASSYIPMDEALGFCSLDISGRPYLVFTAEFDNSQVGEFDTALTEEFFRAFSFNSGITIHSKIEYGNNDHHKIEALFKSLARALKEAVKIVGDEIPSTKGVL